MISNSSIFLFIHWITLLNGKQNHCKAFQNDAWLSLALSCIKVPCTICVVLLLILQSPTYFHPIPEKTCLSLNTFSYFTAAVHIPHNPYNRKLCVLNCLFWLKFKRIKSHHTSVCRLHTYIYKYEQCVGIYLCIYMYTQADTPTYVKLIIYMISRIRL